MLHDLGGSRGLLDLKSRDLAVHNPELTFATPDHAISTAHGRAGTIKIGQVGVVLSAMIWRLQAYLLRWQQHNMTE